MQDTMPPITHKMISAGWPDDGPDSVPRMRLAGEMFALMDGVVKEFHGDMYRDMLTLSQAQDITGDWFLIVRHSGTHLSREWDAYTHATYASNRTNAYAYHFTVTRSTRDRYDIMVSTLKPEV